jgi:hypothetical protein
VPTNAKREKKLINAPIKLGKKKKKEKKKKKKKEWCLKKIKSHTDFPTLEKSRFLSHRKKSQRIDSLIFSCPRIIVDHLIIVTLSKIHHPLFYP